MRSRFLYIWDMLVNASGNIDRFRATAVIKDTLHEVSFYIDVCCLRKDSSRSHGRQMIFKCLAAYLQYLCILCPLIKALNVIVELPKSLPFEVNNSTNLPTVFFARRDAKFDR